MDDLGLGFRVNWISGLIFLSIAVATAYFAQRASGGLLQSWMGLKPVWWFALIALLPWIGLPILAITLFETWRTTRAQTRGGTANLR